MTAQERADAEIVQEDEAAASESQGSGNRRLSTADLARPSGDTSGDRDPGETGTTEADRKEGGDSSTQWGAEPLLPEAETESLRAR